MSLYMRHWTAKWLKRAHYYYWCECVMLYWERCGLYFVGRGVHMSCFVGKDVHVSCFVGRVVRAWCFVRNGVYPSFLDGRELSVLCLLERAYMMHALLWQKYVVHIHYQRLQIVIDSSEWCNLMEWRLPVLHKGKVQNASSHAAVAWWCMYIVLLELFDLNVTLYYWMWWCFIDWYVTIYYWLKCDDVCIVLLELIYWNVTMYV